MLIDDYELTRQIEQMKDVNRDDVIAMIARQKPVDAEPVRHGRWRLEWEAEETRMLRCSECKMVFNVGNGRCGNYCPNCGAKMDVEEQDETD